MRVYLAGPMSGIPNFNFPLFRRVTAQLRADNWVVVSPAELDDKEDGIAASLSATGDIKDAAKTWGTYLARDVKMIADDGIEGIIFLPGWEKSKGARLEAFVGLTIKGFKFYEYNQNGDSYQTRELHAFRVMARIYTSINDELAR